MPSLVLKLFKWLIWTKELSNSAKDATDPVGTVRAYRKITHKRLQKKLFLLDRQARLRSGTRGLAARKALRAFEKEVAESQAHLEQADKEISDEVASTEVEEALNMLAELQIQVEPTRMAEVESKAKKILVGLGFSYSDMERRASTLSGGWTMRMELASCLMEETDILILDEPTNYLDLLGIMWLQQHLVSLSDLDEPPTLIMVSHDRTFLTNSTTDLIILKNKSLTYFHGSLEAYEEGQAEKRLHMTRMKEAQSKQKAHIQDTISKARQQAKQSGDDNKLRQAKSRQKKLDERWGLEASARGGRFKLNRDLAGYYTTMRAEIEVEAAERPVSLVLPEPPDLRFPGALISLENVEFKYPGVKSMSNKSGPTLEKASLTVHMGDRIGILGLNGAGKSTLVRLLANQAHPTSGTATWHPLLRLGYYSQGAVQSLQALAYSTPPDQSPVTALSILTQEAGLSLTEQEIRGLLGSLGLPGRVASDVPVQKLSGGQMVRLELARVLWRRPQVLVLDEVTTHLDYETVRAMRSALRRWRGAVVLVSHDRWFVRGVIEGERDDSGGGDRELDGNSQSEDEDADEEGVPRRRVMYRLCRGVLNVLEGGVNEFEGIVNKKVRRMGIGEKKGGGAGDLRCR